MTPTCCFPDCPTPASRRDDGTWACAVHMNVHVHPSYLEDGRHHHVGAVS